MRMRIHIIITYNEGCNDFQCVHSVRRIELIRVVMAAPTTKVAPPVPARKTAATAVSGTSAAQTFGFQSAPGPSQQRNIKLQPLYPADSNAPMVYIHPAGSHGQVPAQAQAQQTAFSGPQYQVQPAQPVSMPQMPPPNFPQRIDEVSTNIKMGQIHLRCYFTS